MHVSQQWYVPFGSDFPVVSVKLCNGELLAGEELSGEDKQQFIQKVKHQGLHIMAFSFERSADSHGYGSASAMLQGSERMLSASTCHDFGLLSSQKEASYSCTWQGLCLPMLLKGWNPLNMTPWYVVYVINSVP